jgi:Uma2 family endonuclease
MATAIADTQIDLDDLPSRDKDVWYEVVDGALVEKAHMGAQADLVIVTLIGLIQAKCGRLGLCFSGHCGYKGIFSHDPKRLRYPDVSFVCSGRLPDDKPPRGHMQIVPDLIAEVVSPKDNAENVEERLMDFLKAGVRIAWLIYPSTRQVCVFHQGPAALRLGENDTLDGEDVLPGFSCPLKDLFASL